MVTIAIVLLLAGPAFFGYRSYKSRSMELNLGVDQGGQLKPCPDKPNCVVSQGNRDDSHYIAPLPLSGTPGSAMARLKDAVLSLPRMRVVRETSNYLHVVSESLLFRYLDDVEFLIDEKNQEIKVRSASRIGQSDFGVNRRRLEEIRQILSGPESSAEKL